MAKNKGIDKDYFRVLLKLIGFSLVSGCSEEVYIKSYSAYDNYSIYVNFEKGKIDYISGKTNKQSIEMRGRNPDGSPVDATRATTSNFSSSENMVVLECVDRLLMKGYEPNSIILEKSWPSGHGKSSYLDILVQKDNSAYLMIECKTWGSEYSHEKSKMGNLKNDGQPDGQLWAYLTNEINTTKLICLYASHIDNDRVEYINDIIEVKEEWKVINSRERVDDWKKSGKVFKNAGIFEYDFGLYNEKCSQIKTLKQLTSDTAKELFDDFLEILRGYAISDKANAFNKILNIFICKIIDENEPEDNRKFWWDEDTDADKFMGILEDLYKQGMDTFLNIEITDYSDSDIDNLFPINIDEKTKNAIKHAFRKQKTERSSEFAFREIYNRETFLENAKIVKDIVTKIQPYQFRYGHKHQFLGQFFEDLLSTSIKQEAGQFFTPIRIARFICTSLPLIEETNKALHSNSSYILPLTIDYACGSGHFLTEYMDIEQSIINDIDRSKLNKSVIREIGNSANRDDDYKWASKYVYGIEKDYRLAKTTKLNTFLNGDGDANIISADGLSPFDSFSQNLALYSKGNTNNNFTFVIANPPYSVDLFAKTMDNAKAMKSFELWSDKMGDNIECLFIERTTQLLKENGYAAIIVPDSISFTMEDFFIKTRRILFEKFRIKAIVNLSGKCFAKTDVVTKILFLQRRNDKDIEDIKRLLDTFFKTGNDFNFENCINVIHTYLEEYGEGLSFDNYKELILNLNIDNTSRYVQRLKDTIDIQINKDLVTLKKKKDYKNANDLDKEQMEKDQAILTKRNVILGNEYEKLTYYLLTFNDNIIMADTLDKDECKRFTGLSFSEKGGKQGTEAAIVNGLINDSNIWGDKDKLNYYIHKACINIKEELPKGLLEHARWGVASELFDYLGEFKNSFKVNLKKKQIKSLSNGYIEKRFGEVTNSISPNNKYSGEYIRKHKGIYPVLSASTQGQSCKGFIDTFDYDMEGIQIATNGNAGTVTYRNKQKFSVGSDNRVFYLKEELKNQIDLKYLFYQIKYHIEKEGYSWSHKCGEEEINGYYIQLPIKENGSFDIRKQEEIVHLLESKDREISNIADLIDGIERDIAKKFSSVFGDIYKNTNKYRSVQLGSIDSPFEIKGGKRIPKGKTYSISKTSHPYIRVSDMKNYSVSLDDIHYISDEVYNNISQYVISLNDVYISIAGTIGMVGTIPPELDGANLTENAAKFVHRNNEVLNNYFIYYLSTDYIKDLIANATIRQSQPKLSIERIKTLPLLIPSIEEQKSFSDFVDAQNIIKKKLINESEEINREKEKLLFKYFA